MNEIYEIYEMITGACVALIDKWHLKGAFALIGGWAMWLICLRPIQIGGLFLLLVIFDLLTKWSALSYQYLLEMGYKPDRISMLDKWLAIPAAWGKKIIVSKHMRKPFCDKVITYFVATFAAWLADQFTSTPLLMKFAWLYLSGAEFLSILENMRDGGNVTMEKFLTLVDNELKNRLGV